MKTTLKMLCAALAAALLAGCGTLNYGDGKVGPVPLNPVVEKVAQAADAQAPGSGEKVRSWFAAATRDRVPAGYQIVLDHFYDGQLIDPSRIVTVPRLQPLGGSASVVVVTPAAATNQSALSGEVIGLLNQIGAGTAK